MTLKNPEKKVSPIKELSKKLQGRRVRGVVELEHGIQILFGNNKTLTIKHATSMGFDNELHAWTVFALDEKELLRK